MSTEGKTEAAAAQTHSEGSLLDEILGLTPMRPADEGYDLTKKGVEALITELVSSGKATEKVDKSIIDTMIAEIDRKLSEQLDAILHAPAFQKMESTWRSLKFLIDKTDFRENVKVEILNVSKDDLVNDFEESPEVAKSGLYNVVYSGEYGVLGGEPYGLMVTNFEFDASAQDIDLLRKMGSVAAMAHAPILANVSPKFFGKKNFEEVAQIKELKTYLEGPQYARWHSLRESEDSRYIGLSVPKMLLRNTYGDEGVPVKSFNYQEKVTGNHDAYLWGASSYALATRVHDSFAKFRWAPNIIGPMSGGSVEGLPLHQYQAMGEVQTKIPTEVSITDRREFELAEEGFIGLVHRKGSDSAVFFSANSIQKPRTFGNTEEGKAAETNYRLGTQLPYMFVVTRLSHYMKVIQREHIGSYKSKSELEGMLNKWISQYVSDMDDPAPAVRARRPLRKARVEVEDVPGQPGWYRSTLRLQPHFRYMGASFELSLVGKMSDKS
jgi:type VI secretion system protein ImpC